MTPACPALPRPRSGPSNGPVPRRSGGMRRPLTRRSCVPFRSPLPISGAGTSPLVRARFCLCRRPACVSIRRHRRPSAPQAESLSPAAQAASTRVLPPLLSPLQPSPKSCAASKRPWRTARASSCRRAARSAPPTRACLRWPTTWARGQPSASLPLRGGEAAQRRRPPPWPRAHPARPRSCAAPRSSSRHPRPPPQTSFLWMLRMGHLVEAESAAAVRSRAPLPLPPPWRRPRLSQRAPPCAPPRRTTAESSGASTPWLAAGSPPQPLAGRLPPLRPVPRSRSPPRNRSPPHLRLCKLASLLLRLKPSSRLTGQRLTSLGQM